VKRDRSRLLSISMALLLLLASTTLVVAQSSAQFDLTWHVLGSGGRASASANYHVNGTVGQGLASPATLTSAAFQVSSGYWAAGAMSRVFLPLVIRH
jgi:hypothetical protein